MSARRVAVFTAGQVETDDLHVGLPAQPHAGPGKLEACRANGLLRSRVGEQAADVTVVSGKAFVEKAHGADNNAVVHRRLTGRQLPVGLIPGALHAVVHGAHHRLETELGRHVELRRESHFEVPDAFRPVVLCKLVSRPLKAFGVLHDAERPGEPREVFVEVLVGGFEYQLFHALHGG